MSSKFHPKSEGVVIFGLLLFALSACRPVVAPQQPDEVEVPFERIAVEEWGVNLSDAYTQEPHLILITNESDLNLYEPYIIAEHRSSVRNTDYSRYVVLMLLREVQPGSKHSISIESIIKRDDTLIVHAEVQKPLPGETAATAETLPYDIVKIDKDFVDEGTKLELQ